MSGNNSETDLALRARRIVTEVLGPRSSNVEVYVANAEVFLMARTTTATRKPSVKVPSERKLRETAKSLAEALECPIHLVRGIDEDHLSLEAGLQNLLSASMGRLFSDVFLSAIQRGEVDVWLTPRQRPGVLDADTVSRVREGVAGYLKLAGLTLGAMRVVGHDKPTATLPTILSATKILQPVTTTDLHRHLEAKGFAVPPAPWLNRQLDVLRKKAFLLRRKDGRYVLSAAGLAAIPAGIGSGSSDIARALELARRRW